MRVDVHKDTQEPHIIIDACVAFLQSVNADMTCVVNVSQMAQTGISQISVLMFDKSGEHDNFNWYAPTFISEEHIQSSVEDIIISFRLYTYLSIYNINHRPINMGEDCINEQDK